MDLKRLFNKAKKTVDERGGVESLKADAEELKDVATGKGSLTEKAKDATAAIKDPGAPGEERKPAGADSRSKSTPPPGP